MDAATILAQVKPLFGEIGLTRIANVTGLDSVGIPVVSVSRPNSRSNAVSQGKGLTLELAKISGVMESIETWCAEHIVRPVYFASARELAREHRVVDTEQLCRVAGSPLSIDTRILWIEGKEIVSGEACLLPYELVHTDFTLPRPPGSGHFLLSTNGLASHATMAAALLHGLCEVIERDAATLFTLNHRLWTERRVDLGSVDDADCRATLAKLKNAGLAVGVWDITSDVAIAAFRCQIMEQAAGDHAVAIPAEGHGCHPNRAVALVKALVEAAQTRLTAISGARDDLGADIYGFASDPQGLERWRGNLNANDSRRLFGQAPTSAEGALSYVLTCLAAAGFNEVLAVDLSPPAGICAVARVVVPGLEGPMHRFYAAVRRSRAAP